jgi:hypothetical protein
MVWYTFIHLINEIGNEEHKREDAGDECTYPDVFWLATGPLSDDAFGRRTPVPVGTLNNAGRAGGGEGGGIFQVISTHIIIIIRADTG